MPNKRTGGAAREAAKRAKARATKLTATPAFDASLDEVFARLRTGAANVAGVTFQISVAGLLLAGGRGSTDDLPAVAEIRPEGFEDVDCRLREGGWLLVQCKQRSTARPFGLSDIASIVVHASQAETARDYDGQLDGYAIVTDGEFALPSTGWKATLSAGHPGLLEAVEAALVEAGRERSDAPELIARTRLVSLTKPPAYDTEKRLEEAYSLLPAVAAIARAQLAADVAQLSSSQRGPEVATALSRTVMDLDAMIDRLLEQVNLDALDEAVRSGVCEFADFARGSADTEAQFFSGVRVVPGHIAANRDVVRIPECESVLSALGDSNHVLIVGPSGTGKSGLLWRCAAMLQDGPMVLRVLRVETDEDARSLVRYVRLLGPSWARRVIICVDDLGRAATEYWAEARDRLLELPGVSVLGACRQEDLLPSTAMGATLLDSGLSHASASRIYERMRNSGIELHTEPEEAITRAAGLLMEFVAIATTGRRLRDVLSGQVDALRAAGEVVALDSLAMVSAMHTLGRPIDANSLPGLLAQPEQIISRSLERLQDEHLVTSDDGMSWRGLHDLRAEVLLEILHRTPPPTLASTYARSISAAEVGVRPILFRRAAARVIRALGQQNDRNLGDRLTRFHAALRPLTQAVADDVAKVLESPQQPGAPQLVASFVDAAERLDVVAYVGATIEYIDRGTPPSVDISSYFLMAYSSRFSRIFGGNDMFQHMVALGDGLPDWNGTAKAEVVRRLSNDAIEAVLAAAALDLAVHFSERLEGFKTVSPDAAARVFTRQRELSAASRRLVDADLLAQLAATLARLSELDGIQLSAAFGSTEERAGWAAAADDFAFEITVELKPIAQLPSSPSNLARGTVFSTTQFCEVTAKAFARTSDFDQPTRAYEPQTGADPSSLNSQAVFLSQRLFDACPEADVVSVEIVFANMSNQLNGMRTDGEKRMRSGVVPRRVDTERAIAVQVALVELTTTERWSARCRAQAVAVRNLLRLLEQLPGRLGDIDNSRRRAEWVALCEATAAAVARLPGLPIDRTLLETLNEDFPNAADFDRKLREASRDTSRKAIDLIAGCLLQAARGLDDISALGGAGMRLAGARKLLEDARAEGRLPEYAGVGPLLPEALDRAITISSRLLAAFGRGTLAPSQLRSSTLETADGLTATLASTTARQSLAALENALNGGGQSLLQSALVPEPDPTDPLDDLRIVAVVDAGSWSAVEAVLRAWGPADRAASGFKSKAEIAIAAGAKLVPIGIAVWGESGRVLPLRPEDYRQIATCLDMELLESTYQRRADDRLQAMVAESYRRIREAARPTEWPRGASGEGLVDTELAAEPGAPPAWRRTIESLERLRSLVLDQREGQDSLAAALAGVDIASPGDVASPFIQLAAAIRIDSIDADLAS